MAKSFMNCYGYRKFFLYKHILLVDIHIYLLQLTENDHLDILTAIDLYKDKKCELNFLNYNFNGLCIRYYDQFSRIQRYTNHQ
jgi:hypothetical protein